jgi:hypothetical protein
MDLEQEENALRVANRDIAEAKERIKRQTDLIENLRQDGHDIKSALALLAVMQETLQTMQQHRDMIAETVDKIRQGKI